MSTVTENSSPTNEDSTTKLRHTFSAMRLSFCWLGTRKSLSNDQRQQAASQFGAQSKSISAGKKLLDSGHPAMKAVNQLKRQMTEFWKGCSLPYPEAGIRLIRHADLELLNERMDGFKYELELAVRELQANYDEIKDQAAERLGDLYAESDYPASLDGLFEVSWDFPSVEPPEYLKTLSPEVYEHECQRVRSRFDEAVQLAEQAFIDELAGLVTHLGDRLAGGEDGKPKVFRDSAIENLLDFFDRFRRLNVASCPELDQLVARAQDVVQGVRPDSLRSDDDLRQQVASQLSGVQSVLDGLMVDRPRRRILRG